MICPCYCVALLAAVLFLCAWNNRFKNLFISSVIASASRSCIIEEMMQLSSGAKLRVTNQIVPCRASVSILRCPVSLGLEDLVFAAEKTSFVEMPYGTSAVLRLVGMLRGLESSRNIQSTRVDLLSAGSGKRWFRIRTKQKLVARTLALF